MHILQADVVIVQDLPEELELLLDDPLLGTGHLFCTVRLPWAVN